MVEKKSTTKAKPTRKTVKPTEKKPTKGKTKSTRKVTKLTTKKSTPRVRMSKSENQVQRSIEQVKQQTEIQDQVEQTQPQTETPQPVEPVKGKETNRYTSERKIHFSPEIITGLVTLISYAMFRQGLIIPLIILFLLWRFAFKKNIATIVAAFLFALVTSPDSFNNVYIYLFLWVFIGIVIVIEFHSQVIAPIRQRQTITQPSVLDVSFFYVVGIVISYIIQISLCGISLIEKGIFDLIRIQTQILECQYQGTNAVLICIRWMFTAAIFWGSLVVALRRINFDAKNLKQLPFMFLRAFFGVVVTISFSAIVNAVKIFVTYLVDLPPTLLLTYSYLYTIGTIILASLGASFVTKKFD